jgi:hypothetical protein
VEKQSSLVSYNKSEFSLRVFVATAMVKNLGKLVLKIPPRNKFCLKKNMLLQVDKKMYEC